MINSETSPQGPAAPVLEPPAFLTAAPRFEPTSKWVRAMFGGVFIANSRHAMLLWEPPRPTPVYYFPREHVRMDLLVSSDYTRPSQAMGEAKYWSVQVEDKVAENAAWTYTETPPRAPDTSAFIAFQWDKVDAYFEEDDEVFVHPRDPHHRIDVLNSSRHVRIEVAGETVADSQRPRLLFETGLPVRYYLPKLDVRLNLLSPSATVTQCPYKGTASHWSFHSGDAQVSDIAWTYHLPTPECAKIADLIAFYNERVDAIYVEDELQPIPQTPWSRRKS